MVGSRRRGPNAVGLGADSLYDNRRFFGIGIGTMVLVARFTGAQQREDVQRAASRGLGLGFIIGLLVSAGTGLLSKPLLQVFVKDPLVLGYAVSYMRITSSAVAFMIPMNVGSYIMRGVGNTRTPMVIAGIANAINGGLRSYLWKIWTPRLEVVGAATATAAAQIIGSVIIISLLLAVGGASGKARACIPAGQGLCKRIMRLSIPASLEDL